MEGDIILHDYINLNKLEVEGYTIIVAEDASIKITNSDFGFRNCRVSSVCDAMWEGFQVESDLLHPTSHHFLFEKVLINDAKVGIQINPSHPSFDAPVDILSCVFFNNHIGIYAKDKSVTLFNNEFDSDYSSMKKPHLNEFSEVHILTDQSEFIWNNLNQDFSNCLTGIKSLQGGALNIPLNPNGLTSKFTNNYEAAIDLGPEADQTIIADCDIEYPTSYPNIAQLLPISSSALGTQGIKTTDSFIDEISIINNQFIGNSSPLRKVGFMFNAGLVKNLEVSDNTFSELRLASGFAPYGVIRAFTIFEGSTIAIDDNTYNGNQQAIRILSNTLKSEQIPGWTSNQPLEMTLNIHCNSFTEASGGVSSVGISIDPNTYLNNIGDCAGIPGGNGWPAMDKTIPLPWTSPSNWTSIDDANGGAFIYTPYLNEFVGIVSHSSLLPLNTCITSGETFGGSNPTCAKDVQGNIIFGIIVEEKNEDKTYQYNFLKNAYPNPNQGRLKVPYMIEIEFQFAEIEVLSILGNKILIKQQVKNKIGEVTFNCQNLPNGSYLYRLVVDNKVVQQKHFGLVK